MTCHVSVYDDSSYAWEECSRPESCVSLTEHLVHDESSADEMNGYPQRWIEQLLGFTVEGETVFYFDADGKKHHDDGPAEKKWSTSCWYQHGVLHNDDGPARVVEDFVYEWWVNGKRHRENGPAVEYREDGAFEWWVDGKRHRVDGPAVKNADGSEEWWLNGVQVDEATVSSLTS